MDRNIYIYAEIYVYILNYILKKLKKIYIYIYITESLCSTPDTNNTVNQPYFS